MHCYSAARSLRRALIAILLGLVLAVPAQAGRIEPKEAVLLPNEEAYVLSAEFAIDLGPRLEDAVTRGVPLYFNLELVLERPRQYWIAEHIVTRVLSYKLSYSSLTRQYRVTGAALSQNFSSMDEALRLLGRVGALSVIDKASIKAGETYQATLRLSLDRSQLPKPFQVDAITDRDWQVEAKILRWQFVAAEAK